MIETIWENTNFKKIDSFQKNTNSTSVSFSSLIEDKEEKPFFKPNKKNLGPN